MPTELETVLDIAKKFNIDEAIDLYTSKIEVADWVAVKAKHHPDFEDSWPHAVPVDKMRQILHHEYTKAVLLVGKDAKAFTESMIAIEHELAKNGFPKALAFIAGPQEGLPSKARPSLETCGVDALSTLKKFKKNVEAMPPMGLLLLE
jgi:predicted metal-binding protein